MEVGRKNKERLVRPSEPPVFDLVEGGSERPRDEVRVQHVRLKVEDRLGLLMRVCRCFGFMEKVEGAVDDVGSRLGLFQRELDAFCGVGATDGIGAVKHDERCGGGSKSV